MKKDIHVAIVPDGNRRWSKKHKKPIWYGHKMGAKKMSEFSSWCEKYPDVKIITVYALSTENLNRTEKELKDLWDLYKDEFEKMTKSENLKKNGLKINIIGDSKYWRPDVKQAAKELMNASKNYTKKVLNILLAYGGKYEIINAAKELAKKGINISRMDKIFSSMLMVKEPVDLLIRTGGEHRISNMLLYQAAYAEIYFSDSLWPDFSKKEFDKIMKWYYEREKKVGR